MRRRYNKNEVCGEIDGVWIRDISAAVDCRDALREADVNFYRWKARRKIGRIIGKWILWGYLQATAPYGPVQL